MDEQRRQLLKNTAVFVATTPIVAAGCSKKIQVDRKLKFTSLTQGLDAAERLAALNQTNSQTSFSLPQTFIHCAQSIEYSIAGFPEMKSAAFQNTAGSLAFKVFSWRGRMSHNLDEPIPGAEPLDSTITMDQALARLKLSIDTFTETSDALKPHFAYGDLSKHNYELAHAMHLANHFSVIDVS